MSLTNTISLKKDPAIVEVQVSNRIRIAAELAAIANSKQITELMEDILIDHLAKSGYLAATH